MPRSSQPPAAATPMAPKASSAPPESTLSATPELPLYYVEPAPPPPAGPGTPPQQGQFFESEPPPPTPSDGVRTTALWVGARAALFVPFGNVWYDGFPGAYGTAYRGRSFANFAAPGPALELDAGIRLARQYNVFALWEHASLGTGDLQSGNFAGGQNRGSTNLFALGVRYSTDPTSVGLLVEFDIGYREFTTSWADDTRLSLSRGWPDARFGIGTDIRLSQTFSVSPMIVLGGGFVHEYLRVRAERRERRARTALRARRLRNAQPADRCTRGSSLGTARTSTINGCTNRSSRSLREGSPRSGGTRCTSRSAGCSAVSIPSNSCPSRTPRTVRRDRRRVKPWYTRPRRRSRSIQRRRAGSCRISAERCPRCNQHPYRTYRSSYRSRDCRRRGPRRNSCC